MAFSFFAKHRNSCPKNGFHSDFVQFPCISMGLSSWLEVYFSISSKLRFWGIPWYTILLYHVIPPFRTTPNTLALVPLQCKAGNPMMNLWLGATFTKIGIGLWHNPDSPIFDGRFPIFDGALMLGLHIFDGGFRIGSQGYIPFLGHFFIQHPVFWHHLAIPRRIADGRHHQEVTAGVPIEGRHPQVPLWEMRKSLIFGFFWWFGNHFLVGWKNMFQRVYIMSKSLISSKFLVGLRHKRVIDWSLMTVILWMTGSTNQWCLP